VEVTIQDLGSIGEIIGAVATVATLLYLALQIRQGTAATRQTSLYQAIESGQQLRMEFVQNPEAAALYLRGLRDPDSLSPEDAYRFQMLVFSIFELIRLAFLQYQIGTTPEAEWDDAGTWLNSIVSEPGGARIWQDYSRSHEDFRAAVEILPSATAQPSASDDSA